MTASEGASGVTVGDTVVTLDGDQLGRVAEVRGGYFKVDVSMRPDYWLRADAIRSTSGGQVVLGVDKDHLADYKIDNPPAIG